MAREHHPDIHHKMDIFLSEFRILVPALGAVFGFQLIATLQQTFDSLPFAWRIAHFASLAATALAILFFSMPASYHRAADDVEESEAFLDFARTQSRTGFVFMTLSFALTVFFQAERVFGGPVGYVVATALSLTFVLGWWVYPRYAVERRSARKRAPAG